VPKKQKLYCAFIDFKQAFDTVWRNGLWLKMFNSKINGKCLILIKNIYNDIKSCIRTDEGTSAYFPCLNGVRQGENLSPFLFSIFLNDLGNYFETSGLPGIECKVNHMDISILFKLFIILYADDTVLMSNKSDDLQKSLNIFENYCDKWKLTVNIPKTKVLIFGTRSNNYKYKFKFKGIDLEITNEYKYLGVYLSRTNSFFLKAKKYIAEQANKAMFSLLRK
jgi:hypothetical protein